jgi:hemerythrin
MAVVMIDVDHFKAYNDRHGHHGGDHCLRTVAQALHACVRGPTDMVGRYGGEEFIALIYPADADAGAQVVRRMQAAIAEAALPHATSPTAPCVTVSMGMAWLPANAPADPVALVKLADQALYEAKAQGRNRAVMKTAHPARASC